MRLSTLLLAARAIRAASVYKSYSSDITKAYAAETSVLLPKTPTSYSHTIVDGGALVAPLLCKKRHHHHHRHQHLHTQPHGGIGKAKPYSYFHSGQALPAAAAPTALYYVAAPPAPAYYVDANAAAASAPTVAAAGTEHIYAAYKPLDAATHAASHTIKLPLSAPAAGGHVGVFDFITDLNLHNQFAL